MSDSTFKIFIIAISVILLIIVIILLMEMIKRAHKRDLNKYRPHLTHMRSYREGYALSDNGDLSKAVQILYITSDFIEFSDTGINGRYKRIWER